MFSENTITSYETAEPLVQDFNLPYIKILPIISALSFFVGILHADDVCALHHEATWKHGMLH